MEGLGSVDHSEDDDAIGSVSEEFLAQKVKEFNENMADDRGKGSH